VVTLSPHALVTSRLAVIPLMVFAGMTVSAQSTTGVHPRSSAAEYSVSRQDHGATYAASLVPASQVKHIFAADISKTYVVFEVACYPGDRKVDIDPDNFLVKLESDSEFVHPADAVTVASVIERKNTPASQSRQTVYTSANIGYESGTDPYSGRRVHGVYTGAGVGVGPNVDQGPQFPPPGNSPDDRVLLEDQLTAKGLPRGHFTAPVAGYLFFPAASLKKAKGVYQLECLGDDLQKVTLQVPKGH
jgi:hypothetical protein